jgi:putative transposase
MFDPQCSRDPQCSPFALDEHYLRRAARYVELNPVRAKLCRRPWRWPWSSAAAHVAGQDDGVVRVAPLLERVKDWREYLLEPLEAAEEELWRQHERTGRPLGESAFLDRVERLLGRIVRPAQRGPKPKRQKR